MKARLLQAARAALRARGLEINRTGGSGGGPRRTLPEVLEHLKAQGIAPRTIVDVGVARGTPELYAAFPGVPLLLVEPLAEHEDDLRRIVAARPGSRYALAAGGPEPGELEITVHRVTACSSILGDRDPEGDPGTRRTVPVERVDDLVAEHALAAPFLVKVDVEGAELQVLRGAQQTLATHRPLLVFEHGLGSADHYGTRPEDVHDLLVAGHGYRIFDLQGQGPFDRAGFTTAFHTSARVNFLARPKVV